jgi:SAM-dependent methyltransferase
MASESKKILHKVDKYLAGKIVEVGCGDEPVKEGVVGIDGRNFPHVNILTNNLYDLDVRHPELVGKFDCCFSSHVLEHLPDSYRAIMEWSSLVKRGGYFILYLPDGNYYPNKQNPEHFHDTKYEDFIFWFKRTFCGEALNFTGKPYFEPYFQLIESGLDVGEDRYSFYLVAKKL